MREGEAFTLGEKVDEIRIKWKENGGAKWWKIDEDMRLQSKQRWQLFCTRSCVLMGTKQYVTVQSAYLNATAIFMVPDWCGITAGKAEWLSVSSNNLQRISHTLFSSNIPNKKNYTGDNHPDHNAFIANWKLKSPHCWNGGMVDMDETTKHQHTVC